ncbi:MAG: D-glycero-beta-D-manno-heptose 1-phosphate adenylyltransferase [Phycisphaerales bacterium]|jgi:D-beta-D-heptose 7-phosphate kinase/D-beta-D-heptose 1-phosphate adenosyltransferase|nr:D-glycero-beta-D-manno-heptose 1-phosphate adenylyltransferase [Phycisphaerales bacterium]
MDRLLEHLADWKPFTALVVGDFMLDQLLMGDAERLSADAPVPVLHVRTSESRPGGAANVCLDLAALRGRVIAVGAVGDDTEGELLRALIQAQGVDGAGLITDRSRPTTVKRNLVGLAQARHPQKMFRMDVESREPVSAHVLDQIVRAFERLLPRADVVCIEDYNKGVCHASLCKRVIDLARRAGKEVLVDPAAIRDYAKYARATTITPNRTEAELATGMRTDVDRAGAGHNARLARRLLDDLDLDCVVLTLDKHGALLQQHGEEPVGIPTIAREVYDVTGAGDMMLAALAAARANGAEWPDAVRFANAAAGLEVEVFGCVPIPLDRVHHQLLIESGGLDGKKRTLAQALVEVRVHRDAGRKVVFTNGCFDVLHAGHVTLLERARAMGDFLIVGLNSDASVRRLKGPDRPINTQDDRARVLSALTAVDAVVMFDEDTPEALLRAIGPDVLVKGGDYTPDKVIGHEIVESRGGRVEIVEMVPGRSTSATIQRMAKARR